MKSLFRISSAVVLFTAMLSGLGCKKSNDTMPTTAAYQVGLKVDPNLGQYLVDKDGRTLYIFSNDPDGKDSCTGQCQLYWPAFNVTNLTASMLGPELDFADFGSVTSSAGKPQLTYKGWPLYYFAPDGMNIEAPGQIQGDNKYNVWFVAKPDYSIMIVNAQLVGNDGINYKSDYSVGNGITTYFTDAYGRTLYSFSHDSANHNKFTVPDTATVNNYNSFWPIYETDKVVVPSALDKTQFGSITVFGHKQLTYKQWPMYFFYLDTTRGSNKGIAFPQAPAPPASPCIWPVVTQNQPPAPHS
jgi:predicted lipoprotein with Yx(FWY)xxD motif